MSRFQILGQSPLEEENIKLQEELKQLRLQNKELDSLVSTLTRDIQQHAHLPEQNEQLRLEVRRLSRNCLQLMKKNILQQENSQSGTLQNQSEQITDKFNNQVQELKQQLAVVTRMKIALTQELEISREMQKQSEQKISELYETIKIQQIRLQELIQGDQQDVSQLQLRLKNSQKQIDQSACEQEVLKTKIRQLEEELNASQSSQSERDRQIEALKNSLQLSKKEIELHINYKEQLRIAKNWNLDENYLNILRQKFGIKFVPQLRNKIHKLEQEKKQYEILIHNERIIGQSLRKKLEIKEIQLVVKEGELKIRQKQIENIKAENQKSFQMRQKLLQDEYIQKFKSIKQFNSCGECAKQKKTFQSVIDNLRKQLQTSHRNSYKIEKKQKEQIEKGITFQTIVLKQLRSATQNKPIQEVRKHLDEKSNKMFNVLYDQIDRIKKQYKV